MQKRLNPYVVLGIGLDVDARAANLAFIQRVAKFKSLHNPPYSTAELEWALKEIEAAAAQGELVETFDVPAVRDAYDVPPVEFTGLPLVRLDRKTPPGDAVDRYRETLLLEARKTLKDAIAAMPEFFSGANSTLPDAEEFAELPAFGTWTSEERLAAEREAGSATAKPVPSNDSDSQPTGEPSGTAPTGKSARKSHVGAVSTIGLIMIAAMVIVVYLSSGRISRTEVVTEPSPMATQTATTPAVTVEPTPTKSASAKPSTKASAKPSTSKATSAWPNGYKPLPDGVYAYRIMGIESAAEGGSSVRVSVFGNRSCETWQASIVASTANGRETSVATAYDFKNPSPSVVPGRSTTINFLFPSEVQSVRAGFTFTCAG